MGHYKGKTAVFGMVQRGGKMVARVVPTPPKSGDLLPHIRHHVLPATTVFTDEARYFRG